MRLNVRPQVNLALGDFALDMLKREAEERRLCRPLPREAVLHHLRQALRAAEAGNASYLVDRLARVVDVDQVHGLHGRGRDILWEVEATSGRFGQALGRDEPPNVTIARRLRALLVDVEADRFADRAPRAIIAEAVDPFGSQAVLAAAEVDDFRAGVPAGVPVGEKPAKSMRTLHQAALAMLDTQPAEAA